MSRRGQKKSNSIRRIKRHKRRKNRLERVIHHFTTCDSASLETRSFSINPDGTSIDMVCRQCQLRVTEHIGRNEYQIKYLGRVKCDATILDLMALDPDPSR
ncbi:MAG: hypothetical protein AB7L09_02755 [Nitrospira sp.]